MTIDECLRKLEDYDRQCQELLPEKYYEEIAGYWFARVAPEKVREYGTECWERLGPRGFVVNMSAMRYRWTSLVANGHEKGNPMVLNCLHDAFGFSMLFNLCLEIQGLWYSSALILPRVDDEWIISKLWDDDSCLSDDQTKFQIGMRALRMAYNMWKAA